MILTPTFILETSLLEPYCLIAGIDEVGRAPLAGPVAAAAVILDPAKIGKYRSKHKWWRGVRDSKALAPRKRVELFYLIKTYALDFGIGVANEKEIDEQNIQNATFLAMRRALANLVVKPEIILVDGNRTIPRVHCKQKAIIGGDAKILSIACASILAKVFRDDLMSKISLKFPEYGFAKHKGYDTEFHRKKLLEHGPCILHRLTFATVRKIMNERFGKI